MQLFNGITLGVIDFYRAKYGNSDAEKSGENEGDPRLTKLEAEIAQINDNVNETNDDIEGLDGVLTREFAGAITSDVAKKLLHEIQGKYTDKKLDDLVNDEAIHQSIKDLINFLQPIADPLHNYPTGNFIDKQGVESKSNSLIPEELESRKKGVEDVLKSLENQTDERLNKIKTTLDNINKVLSSPSEGNVKQLQKFIWDMLKDSDNSLTISGKKYSESGFCDGTLGNGTLAGLEVVLVKIGKYVDDVKEAISVEDRAAKAEGASDKGGNGDVDGAKPTAQVPEAQHDAPKQESKFFANYSVAQGVQVAEMAASMVLYSPDVKPAVESDESSGSDSNERSSKGIDQNVVLSAVEKLKALGSAGESTENVYLTEVGGKPLAVRLDSEGCLYPFAVDVKNNRLVFLENNTSCMKYLENKLGVLKNEAYIGWNGRRYVIGRNSDHEKSRLQIEPTTIAGQWVSPDLGRCLAFLNFTNYLRNEPGLDRGKFKNDNPDLKWKDGKLFVRVKKMDKHDYDKNIDDSKSWMYVDLRDFGLEGVSQESDEWRKFIKYNNSEQWEDLRHFDKLDDKFDYSTLDIQAVLDKQARRARAKAGARAGAGTPNPGVLGGGLGEKPTVGGSNGRDVLDSNSGTLKAVNQDFDRGNFGISGADVTVFVLNGAYYYQDVNTVHQVTGFTDQEAILPEGQSLSYGQDISNLNFSTVDKLAITKGGAEALAEKLRTAYKKIKEEDFGYDVSVTLDDNRENYVLKFGSGANERSIVLGGENFVKQGKIFGYDIDKPEQWMKVVCYAVDNYENLAKGSAVLENESYGINEDNVSLVNKWVSELVVANFWNSIIREDNMREIDNFEGSGLGINKTDLNIPENAIVYASGEPANWLFYKNNDEIVKVSLDEPWLMGTYCYAPKECWDGCINVCSAGVKKLNSLIANDNYLSSEKFNFTLDDGKYVLNKGKEVIPFKSVFVDYYSMFRNIQFCGKDSVVDKIKLVYLNSVLKSEGVSALTKGSVDDRVSSWGVTLDDSDFDMFKKYYDSLTKGEFLNFCEKSELTKDEAKQVVDGAQFHLYHFIELKNLRKLNVDVAKEFSSYGGFLKLPCLETIDVNVANELANRNKSLEIGLKVLDANDVDVVKKLASIKDSLRLDKLETMDVSVARELAKHSGFLNITLKEINIDVAKELVNHNGELHITLENDISVDVARELTKLGNKLHIFDNHLSVEVEELLKSGNVRC